MKVKFMWNGRIEYNFAKDDLRICSSYGRPTLRLLLFFLKLEKYRMSRETLKKKQKNKEKKQNKTKQTHKQKNKKWKNLSEYFKGKS